MFQESALFPWLSVRGNIDLALRLAGVPKAERHDRASDLLRMVQLKGMGGKRPHELSGGMRQRVALARALAQDASSPAHGRALRRPRRHHPRHAPRRARAGVAGDRRHVVFVTHNVREAVRLGDRVLVLSSRPGRVVDEFHVDIPRPRRLDDSEVSSLSGTITDRLRQEVRRHGANDTSTRQHSAGSRPRAGAAEAELAGLDALDVPIASAKGRFSGAWQGLWPKLAALALFFGGWQVVAWLEAEAGLRAARPDPGAGAVLGRPHGAACCSTPRPRRCSGPSSATPSRWSSACSSGWPWPATRSCGPPSGR